MYVLQRRRQERMYPVDWEGMFSSYGIRIEGGRLARLALSSVLKKAAARRESSAGDGTSHDKMRSTLTRNLPGDLTSVRLMKHRLYYATAVTPRSTAPTLQNNHHSVLRSSTRRSRIHRSPLTSSLPLPRTAYRAAIDAV